ncbi:MAG: hypothetical protein Q8Q36_02515 [bacterium]|nr:hypothetical protein [bacterium]
MATARQGASTWKRDCALISLSVLFAVALVKGGVLEGVFSALEGAVFLGAFVAGGLFTSFFTVPIALAAFGELTGTASPWTIALWGAFGATLADAALFAFVKLRLSTWLIHLFEGKHHEWLRRKFRYRTFRLAAPLVGAIAIASPIPDEVGLTLLGLAKAPFSLVVPLSFVLHLVGIWAVVAAFQAVA